MAKDKIQDLRHHLFAQLERLSDDADMKNPITRSREIERADGIVKISQAIINSAKLEIDYLKALASVGTNVAKPTFLGLEEKK